MTEAGNAASREPGAPGRSESGQGGSAHRRGGNPPARAALAALALAAAAAASVPGVAAAQTRATVTVAATLPTTQLEGGPVWFEVERSGTATDEALDVAVQVSETGSMLPAAAKGRRTVTIPEFGAVGHLVIDSIGDLTDEADSTVTVFLLGGSGYRIGSPSRAQATVTDDDIPVVNVEAVAGSVREGRPAVFRITRAGLTAGALTVDLEVFDRNGALTGTALATGSATIGAGRSSALISLATQGGNADGRSGEAWVQVLAGAGYTTGDSSEAMVRVADDALPMVTVEAVQDPVNEGVPAQFTVTRTGVLDDALEVRLAVSETGDMVDAALPGRVVIPAGQSRAAVEIPTVDDATDERDGSVRVSLLSSSAYRVGTARSATVGIADTDTPTVGIAALGATVTEGAAARFRLTRTGHTGDTLIVPLSILEEGDVLTAAARGISSVTFARGRATAELRLATDNDAIEEHDGRVSVYLDPGATHGLSLTAQDASVAVTDNDRPGVSIAAESDAITEGQTAAFSLSRDGLGESAITVRVSVRKQGAMFADSAAETVDVTFAADVFAARFSIETVGDEADEADGAVTATLLSGTGFSLRAARSARIEVRDDDLVNITVAAPASPIAEGSTAVFTFTRDGTASRELEIRVFHFSSGKWTAADTGTTTVRFARGASTARLSLPIYDDRIDNDTDAIVGVSVLRTYAHEIAGFSLTGSGGATVAVTDNDASTVLPVVSASASGSVTEGQDAVFTLRRTGITGHPLRVAYRVTETGAMLDDGPNREAVIARGSSTLAVRVGTRADDVTEESSTLTLRVVEAYADYTTNAATDSASLTARDNPAYVEPTVTIRRLGSETVNEGTGLRFRVSRTGTTFGRISVDLDIRETGRMLRRDRPRSVTLDPNASSATVALSTDNDVTVEQPSVVTVRLHGSDRCTRCTVGSPNSASVTVRDNDDPASIGSFRVWVGSASGAREGGNARFVLRRSGAMQALTVAISVAETGATIMGSPPTTASFASGSNAVTVQVPTEDDTTAEAASVVTLTVARRGGYFLGTPWSRSVTVTDDDAPAGSSLSLSRSVSSDDTETDIRAKPRPALSVADSSVDEAPGAALDFVVTLSPAASRTVTVDYGTGNGTANAGTDYRRTAGTLSFRPGETLKTVSVPVLDDAHDEGSETMTLALSNPSGAALGDGEATGTIRNTDAMPAGWMARFGRAAAEHAIGAVEARLESPRAPGFAGSVAGRSLAGVADGGAAGEGASAPPAFASRTATGRELLTGSSFALAGGSAETGFAAFWGSGAVTRFDGRAGRLALDGEVASAMLGADVSRGPALAGLMVSHARGDGAYRSGDGGGEVSSSLTTVLPYGRYALGDRVSLWGMAGYGKGGLTLNPRDGATRRPDADLLMGAVGVRGVLLAGAGDGPTLAAKSDAYALRMRTDSASGLAASEAQVTRLRLALEGSRPLRIGAGAVLTPSLELGLRRDGGDAETGSGADIGAGIAFADRARGLSAAIRARGLLAHDAGGFRDRGLSGTLAFDPAPDTERGLSLGLAHSLGGAASGGADALLARPTLADLGAGDGDGIARRSFEARLGYGFAVFGDRWTAVPELRLGLSHGLREARLGLRVSKPAAALEMRLEAARREPAGDDDPPENRIALTAAARW